MVSYTISGTATCGTDYTISGADCATNTGSFTLPAGTGEQITVFTVSALADNVPDGGETIILTLVDGAAYDIDADNVRTIYISVSPPTGLTATAGNGQVTLNWDNPNNPEITKYQVSVASTGQPFTTSDIPGSNAATTSHTVTGLTNGTTYSFVIRAFSGSRSRDAVESVTATPLAPLPPPEPEDDDPGLVPSTVSLAVLRGGAGRFSLKLDTAPTATVAVTVSVSDGKGWMVDTDPGSPGKQTTLLFTPTNWNQPQEVVVSAGQEGEGVATVVINASGGDYEGLRAAIRVEVVEQDQGTATEAAKGWQVRFGRTVAQQVVDAVQGRLTAAPSPVGLHLTVAGEDLSGMPLEENEGALAKVLGFETVTTGQVMQDSAFSFSPLSPSPTAAPTAAPPAAAGAAEGGEGDTRGRGRSRGRWRTPVGRLG